MKRNINLVNLSSEHHDGLVIALRLKKALAKNITPKLLIEYVQLIWPGLKHHFDQEEDNFLIPNKIDPDQVLVKQMLNEHREFDDLIQLLVPSNPNIKLDLLRFSELLKNHIRFEERQLFPFIEEVLDTKSLEKMGQNLAQTHRPLNPSCGVAFWD